MTIYKTSTSKKFIQSAAGATKAFSRLDPKIEEFIKNEKIRFIKFPKNKKLYGTINGFYGDIVDKPHDKVIALSDPWDPAVFYHEYAHAKQHKYLPERHELVETNPLIKKKTEKEAYKYEERMRKKYNTGGLELIEMDNYKTKILPKTISQGFKSIFNKKK